MARTPFNIPLRFRFRRFCTKWECGKHPEAMGEPTGHVDVLAPVTELDGWALRAEFFKLPREKTAYVDFLNKVGLWFPLGISREIAVAPDFENSGIWTLRDDLRRALKDPAKFIEHYAHGDKKRMVTTIGTSRFELDGKVPVLVIETTCFYELLVATICADLIQGFKFRFCARKDCAIPFAIETAHERKFCTQYCGHLESMRRKRRSERKQRRTEN